MSNDSKSFFWQSFSALTGKRKGKQNQRDEVQNEPDGMTRFPAQPAKRRQPGKPREDKWLHRVSGLELPADDN
jgi:hypothetical protein